MIAMSGALKIRKKRKRKSWKHSKNKLTLLVAAVLALVLFIFVISIFYVVVGTYKGLGNSLKISESEYSQSFYYYKDGFRMYSDSYYKSTKGIDVSTFQGKINWEKVKADGVDFAMIRLGYSGSDSGSINMDSRFKENLKGAKAAGIKVGVYFFSQAITTDEAVNEAKYVVRHIRRQGITYPVAYDMEHMENDRISQLTDKQRTQITDAFCTIIQNNGFTPMVYGNQKWLLHEVDLSYLTKYNTWLAHYSTSTAYPYAYKMWQYSNEGKVSGISNHVDLNVCYIKK